MRNFSPDLGEYHWCAAAVISLPAGGALLPHACVMSIQQFYCAALVPHPADSSVLYRCYVDALPGVNQRSVPDGAGRRSVCQPSSSRQHVGGRLTAGRSACSPHRLAAGQRPGRPPATDVTRCLLGFDTL